MVLTSVLYDALADIFHNDRKLVAADVRVGIDQDGRIGSKAYKLMENFADVSPL